MLTRVGFPLGGAGLLVFGKLRRCVEGGVACPESPHFLHPTLPFSCSASSLEISLEGAGVEVRLKQISRKPQLSSG